MDALATPYILTDDAASSELMVALHSAALENEEFAALLPLLTISHLYGVSNEFSDACSRQDWSRLTQLSAQLKLSPSFVPPHAICQSLLHIAAEYASPR